MRYIESYTHQNRIGVLLELHTPDQMAARTPEFKALAAELALQIAAMSPDGLDGESTVKVTPAGYAEAASNDENNLLMDRAWIKDPDINVRQRIGQVIDTLKVSIKILRFVRYSVDD